MQNRMIRLSNIDDSNQISFLHLNELNHSFLSSLGFVFLVRLYKYLIENELVIVCEENGKIIGFVSLSFNSSMMMKKFVLNNMLYCVCLFLKMILKPNILFKMFETLFSTIRKLGKRGTKFSKCSIHVELLSIAVDRSNSNYGIGSKLLRKLEIVIKNRDFVKYKVLAGEKLEIANKFYVSNGFQFVEKFTIHRGEYSNLYVKTLI